MATVSVGKEILNEYTWGSYPYVTWKGNVAITWADTYKSRTIVSVDEDKISFSGDEQKPKTLGSFDYSFANATGTFDDYKDSTLDKFFFDMRKPFNESFNAIDSFDRRVFYTLNRQERIDIDETYWDNIRFLLQFIETFKVRDTSARRFGLNKKEVFKLAEKVAKSLTYFLSDAINVSEQYKENIQFDRRFAERINLAEKKINEFYRPDDELVGVDDSSYRSYGLNKRELTALSDNFRRQSIFRRIIDDAIHILETPINHPKKSLKDSMSLYDSLLRASNAVLSDIFISEKLYSDEDFINTVNTMGGYTPFVDFKVGEYEYKDAMVRVVLQSDSQAEPTAQGITMHVDIPDTDDRGFISITKTTEATFVQFNKHYYTIPEVQVTLRGGSSVTGNIVPHITTIDTHGFYVELLGSSGRATGSISWVSKGY